MAEHNLRGIAVVDVGYTNSKVILYDPDLRVVAERKITSPHHKGLHYSEIDIGAITNFAKTAILELDGVLPVDTIVPCGHGACIVSLQQDHSIAVPVMDYMSDPPPEILTAYTAIAPTYAETYSPQLPLSLLHAMQLFWQSRVLPQAFAEVRTILPLMQYVAFALGGRLVSEVSSMSCQSHLVDMRNDKPSSLAVSQGWAAHFAPRAKAWDVVGNFTDKLHGEGKVLAGIHDSNANFLRYLAGGEHHFTLLSTGTWIIGFDTDADVVKLDHNRDIVANKNVFGKSVACGRFFGGKEFEVLAGDAASATPSLAAIQRLVDLGTMALPSFTSAGGPLPGSGGKGRIQGSLKTAEDQASLAALYCALMVSEMLDALESRYTIIVDGPFSQNHVFLGVLADLRANQPVKASEARDGTAAGAACLALMPHGQLPNLPVAMKIIESANISGLQTYQTNWRTSAKSK